MSSTEKTGKSIEANALALARQLGAQARNEDVDPGGGRLRLQRGHIAELPPDLEAGIRALVREHPLQKGPTPDELRAASAPSTAVKLFMDGHTSSQRHPQILTLHSFDASGSMQSVRAKALEPIGQSVAAVLPTFHSEFSDPENRPVFENILAAIKEVPVGNVIIGLDGGTPEHLRTLTGILRDHGLEDRATVHHNFGRGFEALYGEVAGLHPIIQTKGKGRNMFMSVQVAKALGATSAVFLDADIRTFDPSYLTNLAFGVAKGGGLELDFVKAYYHRVTREKANGRVKQNLVVPLLSALEDVAVAKGATHAAELVRFLRGFEYPISGEIGASLEHLSRAGFAMNWAVEINHLVDAWENARPVGERPNIGQAPLGSGTFEHKHQSTGGDDKTKGLNNMCRHICDGLIRAMVTRGGFNLEDRDLLRIQDAFEKHASSIAISNDASLLFHGMQPDAEQSGKFLQNHARPALRDTLMALANEKNERGRISDIETLSWDSIEARLPGIDGRIRETTLREREAMFAT